MKRKISIIMCIVLLLVSNVFSVSAANSSETLGSQIEVSVQSPDKIDATPVYDGDIEILIKNVGDQTISALGCYLTIIDIGRKQTYPVDEFGENAFQTRMLPPIKPGESITVLIPVHILYVGDFRFTASVIDAQKNQVVTGDALDVQIHAVSNLDKNLVMIVSAVVPVLLASLAWIFTRRKSNAKK